MFSPTKERKEGTSVHRSHQGFTVCSLGIAVVSFPQIAALDDRWHGAIEAELRRAECSNEWGFLALRNRTRHFIFEDSWVVWIWLRSSSSRESYSLVKTNSGFVIACDHQHHGARIALTRPRENLVNKQTAYSLLPIGRRRSHRNKMCSAWIVLVQK